MIRPLAYIILLGVTLIAHAQQEPVRTFRFIGDKGNFTGLQMRSDLGAYIPVEITPYSLSGPYVCPRGSEIKLTKTIPGASSNGASTPTTQTVASIPIPEGHSPFFIILSNATASTAPYPLVGTVLVDSYLEYPAQSLRLINLCSRQIAVKVDAETRVTPVGSTTSFNFKSENAMNLVQVAISIRPPEWTLGFTGAFAIKPTQRAIAIAHDNPNPPNDDVGPVLLNFIKERPPKRISAN